MKKGLKVVGFFALGLGLFGTGGLVGANSDWQTEVISESSSRLGQAGYQKKEELLSKDVSEQMKQVLEPTIQEQQEELERLLEEYYQMKINGLQDTEDYAVLEQRIKEIKQTVYERYVKEIDAAFQ